MPTRRWVALWTVGFLEAAVAADTARPAAASRTVAIRAMRLDTQRLPLIRLQQPPQPLFEGNLRLPAQQLARPRDVGLAHLGVVDRQRLEHDLARGAGRLEHLLCELEEGVFRGIADVHRQMLTALREQHESTDQIVDVTETARLRTVAEHRQRLVRERLADERRNSATVVRTHAR